MRIAQISAIDGSRTEGTAMRVCGLTRSLHDLGQSVILVCHSNSESLVGDFEKADVPLIRSMAWFYGPSSPLETLVSRSHHTRSLIHRVISPLPKVSLRAVDSCSVLHCHQHRVAALVERKRKCGQKLLFDFHGMIMLTDMRGIPIADVRGAPIDSVDFISNSRAIRWQRRIFEEADGISFVTAMLRDRVADLYDLDFGKTHVIPDGVDFSHISQNWTRDAVLTLRLSWGASASIVVMYIGTIDSLHGARYLERVVHELFEDSHLSQSVKFVVAGGGRLAYEFADLRREFGDKLVYLPGVTYELLPTYLAAADILVVPHQRNLQMDSIESGKLLNYLASGKATVATSLASTKGLLDNGVTALLCDPYSPSAMVSSIDRLVNSPELRNTIGGRGAELVRVRRDWSSVARKTLEVYDAL